MRLVKLAIAVLLLLAPMNVFSCGPFFDEVYFSYTVHPDLPLAGFAAGKLGVVQPTYARGYLYVAYQYLNGKSFDAAQQKQLEAFWTGRMRFWPQSDEPTSPSQSYLAAREQYAALVPAPKEIDPNRTTADYMEWQNCTADAFRTAEGTMKARAQAWGAQSAELRQWLEGQDGVFANCGGKSDAPNVAAIPKPVEVPPLLRQDREYQIAASYFYAMKYDDAAAHFQQIAGDPSSPWAKYAPYLRVRALIRKATMGAPEQMTANLTAAEQELDKLLADKSYPLHNDLLRLRGFVAFRLDPEKRLAELAKAISDPRDPNLAQDLTDYLGLVDNAGGPSGLDDDDAMKAKEQETRYSSTASTRQGSDMTDWILTYQRTSVPAVQHAVARWKQTKSPAWLVAAISKAPADSPDATALIEATKQLAPNSPGFATANYHAVRLLAAQKELEAARARLAEAMQSGLPLGAKNLLEVELAMSAPDAAAFLQHAAQRPVAVYADDGDGSELPIRWDEKTGKPKFMPAPKDAELLYETAASFNTRLPLAVWLRAVQGTELPAYVRGDLALAGWTRAVILHDESAKAFATAAIQLRPETKAALQPYLGAAEAEREHAALVAMLDMPGARPFVTLPRRATKLQKIDNYRDNWWCADVGGLLTRNNYSKQERDPGLLERDKEAVAENKRVDPDVAAPAFLSEDEAVAGAAEWKRLHAIGSGPLYLAQQALAWQKAQADDPRVPQALYGAVRANRYSCGEAAADKAADQALAVLRKQYPKSPWLGKALRLHQP